MNLDAPALGVAESEAPPPRRRRCSDGCSGARGGLPLPMARSRSVRCAPAWRRIPRESIAAWDTSQRPGRCFHSREFGTLAAGASCNITVWFSPIATGARTGTLTVSASVATVPASVALSGTGTSPGNLTLSPSSLTFGKSGGGDQQRYPDRGPGQRYGCGGDH